MIGSTVISPSEVKNSIISANSAKPDLRPDSSIFTSINRPRTHTSNLYWENTKGFNEKRKYSERVTILQDSPIYTNFTITSNATSLRYDPLEGDGIICKKVEAWINAEPAQIQPVNAIHYGEMDIFVTSDPQYLLPIPVKKGDVVTIKIASVQTFSPEDFMPIAEGNTSYGGPLHGAIHELQAHYEDRSRSSVFDLSRSFRRK